MSAEPKEKAVFACSLRHCGQSEHYNESSRCIGKLLKVQNLELLKLGSTLVTLMRHQKDLEMTQYFIQWQTNLTMKLLQTCTNLIIHPMSLPQIVG
jgi:hypothetical protein